MNAGSLYAPRDQPEKRVSETKQNKTKHGVTKLLRVKPVTFIFKKIFIPFPQMMLCTLSSGLQACETLYDPLLIKAAQPENLFSLKVFFLYISNLCQPQKVSNKVIFLMEQRCSKLQQRKNQLAQILMWLISRLLFCLLTFQLC